MRLGENVALLGAAFQIGRSALAAYQAAISITGQNIANVGNPDYARQTGQLDALPGGMTLAGVAPGAGVNLSGLERHIDEAVEARLRLALGQRSGAQTIYQTLSGVEALYNELTDADLSSQLSAFFSSLSDLQTDPAEPTTRNLVISNAGTVIQTLQRQRNGLLSEVEGLNKSAAQVTETANSLAQEIAHLNEQVVAAEAQGQGGAGPLRDRRDSLLRQLGELMDIQVREQDNGIVNVYVGSEPLVDFNRSRGLKTQTVREDGLARVTVRFADNNGTVVMRSGKLAAIVQARDVHLAGQLAKIDQLTAGLIYEVNCVHSSGRGLVGYTQLTGSYALQDANVALSSSQAGVPFPVQNGTFLVHVRDQATGRVTTRMIEVDLDGLNNDDTTLNSLAAALDNVPGITASVTGDNRLQLSADAGWEISFSEDNSHALAALGVGTFFEGTNATTIAVNAAVRADPRLLATSVDGTPGDGTNAGRLAAVGASASALLGNVSIQEFHEAIVTGLGVDTAAANTEQEAADAAYSSLLAQREATSGVSLDEETINLMKYEQSFQGASRFLSVVNSLTDEVLNLVQ
jgi:flagellar hook-associated protein 1 FlgK